MTLLISIFAAIAATLLWYKKAPDNTMRLGTLSLMFWGASLMWLVDAVFEYAELGAEYFTPALQDMANDAFLGLSVVALGLAAWLFMLIVRDPKGVVKAALSKNK